MILEHTHYRQFLKAILAEKTSKNGAYSLRSFAQKLGFSNSFLSEVLNGKKSLSTDGALRIAVKLSLTEIETQYFCLLVQIESEKDPEYKSLLNDKLIALKPITKRFDLSSDFFRVISDWYHLAILELTQLKGPKLTPKLAAKRLQITEIQAETAIERLIRLELLERTSEGHLKKTKEYILAQSQIPNSAIKKFHKQLLEKAMHAVDDQTPAQRVSNTDLIPMDSRYLAEAKQIIDRCSDDIVNLTKKSKVKDEVFCLTTHFYKLSVVEKL